MIGCRYRSLGLPTLLRNRAIRYGGCTWMKSAMVDVVDELTRSRMMSGIRANDTKPELMIRKALHARGFRYRLHAPDMPGKPDLVFPRYRSVIFIHGCFWHGHSCRYFKWPKTRPEFWVEKIGKNIDRDARQLHSIQASGWRTMVIWECATRSRTAGSLAVLIDRVSDWLVNGGPHIQIDEAGLSVEPCSTIRLATTSKA